MKYILVNVTYINQDRLPQEFNRVSENDCIGLTKIGLILTKNDLILLSNPGTAKKKVED